MGLLFLAVAGIAVIMVAVSLLRGPVKLSLLTGQVTGLGTRSETTVEGHGSGYGPGPVSVKLTSNTTTHREFFLRDDKGIETPIHVWGFDLPLANGQTATMIRAQSGAGSRHAALVNHATRRSTHLWNSPTEVLVGCGAASATWLLWVQAAAIAVAICYGLAAAWDTSVTGAMIPAFVPVTVLAAALLLILRRLRAGRLARRVMAREREVLEAVAARQIPA